MTSAEKVLEEIIREIGNRLAAPPSAVDELLSLLDQGETLLSRVEQSHLQTMSVALRPLMKGLIAKALLGHPDTDVKIAVASCISEITRITAPVAPYKDHLMKEYFEIIVEAFGKLDDTHDRSYSRRVSILETVSKVRSCVVMLDLECHVLILDMFLHFLKTIRDSHPENIFSSMELIMTVILEESGDFSSHLFSCLLRSVKKNNKDISPIARRLAEKVIGNCDLQLKYYLMNGVQSLGAPLDDYTEIVCVCQKKSDVMVSDCVNISGECLTDNDEFSVRAVCDELPKCSEMLESRSEEVGNASAKSPKSVMSNGTVQMENGDSLLESVLPNKKNEHPGCNISPVHTATSALDRDTVDTALDQGTKGARGREINSVIHSVEISDHSQIDCDKDAVESLNQHKCSGMEVNSSEITGTSDKEAEAIVLEPHEKITEVQSPGENTLFDSVSILSSAPSEKFHDSGHCKRGRRPKSLLKKARRNVDAPVSPIDVARIVTNEGPKNEDGPSVDISPKNQNEGVDSSQPEHASVKEAEATVLEAREKVTEIQFPTENSLNGSAPALSTAPTEKFHGRGCHCHESGCLPKRPLKMAAINENVHVSQVGLNGSSRNGQTKNEDVSVPSVDISSKNQNEEINELEPKGLGHSVKKRLLSNVGKDGKPSRDSHSKMEVEVLCDLKGKLLRTGSKRPNEREVGTIQDSKNKRHKGRVSLENTASGEPTLKEKILSSDTDSKTGKDENCLVETPKLRSQKKRAREKLIFETSRDGQKYDASLIGAKIRVWWPGELQFYRGVISSYFPVSKKHKILYADGDQETLLLKNQVFEFINGRKEEGKDDSTAVSPRQTRSGTKSKDYETRNFSKSNGGKSKAKQKQLRFSTRQSDANVPSVKKTSSKGKALSDIYSKTGKPR